MLTIVAINPTAGRYQLASGPTSQVILSNGKTQDSLWINHDAKRFGPLKVGDALEVNEYGTDRVGDFAESDAFHAKMGG